MNSIFPGTCCVCGSDYGPGEQIGQHPSIVGPRGGKKYAHEDCMHQRNPFNPHRIAPNAEILGVSRKQLKARALDGDPVAIAELNRRDFNKADKKKEGVDAYRSTVRSAYETDAGKALREAVSRLRGGKK